MVNAHLTPADPEVALALSYAPGRLRARLSALWAFDARLAAIVRSTREPTLGRMRLTWWHDAVSGKAPPAGEPLVAAVRAAALPNEALARMVDGWEALLDGTDAPALRDYAAGRGGGVFAAAAAVLGAGDPVAAAGAGWALVDLARHSSGEVGAVWALTLASEQLARAPRRWSRAGRPLGALAKLARRDLDGLEAQGSPRRVLAAAMLALTGR